MKRILLLMLSVVVSTMMMADDVTPEEALQQATQFVQNRAARGNGPRLAPGVQPKLTLASRVSDLYVFNVSDDAGFIIVSNDDCAIPVLGYSDSGSFDANNLPDNMRAWLQGYADEIAWAKANHVTKPANAPMKAALGADIPSMITTFWNQGNPYNKLCPAYQLGAGTENCVTGCVATAMAQVMNYYQWPAKTKTAIPGYTNPTRVNGTEMQVNGVPAETSISWTNMHFAYGSYCDNGGGSYNKSATYTDAQATAVAQLMWYCGASVEMNYGTSSSAVIAAVPDALKTYFDYNEKTTHRARLDYTTANWLTMIYYELNNNRPVLYGGQSTGGGHAFVCDGYKYENTQDYFHINWGWAGLSNGFFTLSALDPEAQGFGGSSTNSGFNYDQEAVIGIDKSTKTITLADVSPKVVDIEVVPNSVSPLAAIVDQPQTITIGIKNNSADDFDNYIGLYEYIDNTHGAWITMNSFQIASGNTQYCEFTFTPTNTGTMTILVMKPTGGISYQSIAYFNFDVYPANVSGTMNEYGWATFSSEYPLDFNNVEGDGVKAAYIVSGFSGNAVAKTPVTKVPKNTGLLLKGTPNAAYTIPVTLGATDDVSTNKLVAVAAETEVSKATEENTTNYVLTVQDEKVVFASINTVNATVPAGRAYLTLTENSLAPWLAIEGDGDATGILNMNRETTTNNVYYDLQGRRVEHPTKGVYVVNGKKVVIK